MAISELQMGLVGAGGVVVVGIFAFNKWQERKHRKQNEQAAASVQEPVLSELPTGTPAERVEPVITDEAPARAVPSAQAVERCQRPARAPLAATRGG